MSLPSARVLSCGLAMFLASACDDESHPGDAGSDAEVDAALVDAGNDDGGLGDAGTDGATPPTPVAPAIASASFFAPTAQALPVAFEARGNGAGVRVSSLVVESCAGDLTSTLVIAGTTVQCASLPQTIAVLDATGDTDDGVGLVHHFAGTWTPTAASVAAGFSVTVRVSDSHEPSLSSSAATLVFNHHLVNQPPSLRLLVSPAAEQANPGGFPAGQDLAYDVCVPRIDGLGSSTIGLDALDPDLDVDDTDGGFMLVTVTAVGIDGVGSVDFVDASNWSQNGSTWTLSASLPLVRTELEGLHVTVSDASAQFEVRVELTDNGHSGSCSQTDLQPCPKLARATFDIDTPTAAGPTGMANPFMACP